ncbi:MAG: hypothetical protein U5K54_13855 [Cytophagales bacterium]|nr:hypothetical protein [Cytophagales bacterium]
METDLSQDELLSLSNLLTSDDPLARLHALWILDGRLQLSSARIITALADASPAVRENALIVSEQLVTNRCCRT